MIQFLTTYWLMIATILLVVFTVLFIFLKIRKTESKRTKWIKNVKPGDLCYISSVGDEYLNNVEIIGFEDEYVTVKVKVQKRWIYPPDKK